MFNTIKKMLIQHTPSEIHQEKNKLTSEMLNAEIKAESIAKKAVDTQDKLKHTITYKFVRMRGVIK